MARSSNKARTKSLHDSDYARFVKALAERRDAADLSQRDVADALGWNQSVIAKIETAQRRVDLIELIRIAAVVGFRASELLREFETTVETPPRRKPRKSSK